MPKDKLLGKTIIELQQIVKELGFPSYTSRQITEWLYKRQVKSIDEMTNLSKKLRQLLNDQFYIGLEDFSKVEISKDGTKKYLFPVSGKYYVESAYIPEQNRATLCISTQVGCRMGCAFCLTGKQRFQANLTSAEILNQILSLPELDTLTNVVYMGMGEPFDNYDAVLKSLEIITSYYGFAWSPTRITVSTIGIIPEIKQFLKETKCHLAISLHNPFNEERKTLLPVANKYTVTEIINELKKHNWRGQRRVSFEYIMFKGINDSNRHFKELSGILSGLRCRVNLLRFNPFPGAPFESSDEKTIIRFKEELNNSGILTTIRTSRGQDISAACGLLSTSGLSEEK